jgi:GT2 family glycosyltransferase
MIHVVQPYRSDKNLGKAYNETIRLYPDNAWLCLLDYDAMFLTPDAISHVEQYTKQFPGTGIFTCFTNRLHPLSHGQLLGSMSEDTDIRHHIDIAEKQKRELYKATPINNPIGGFCMVVNKATWRQTPFSESKKCLGVDNDFSRAVLDKGGNILRMDGIYAWHSYRLVGGYKSKGHLM